MSRALTVFLVCLFSACPVLAGVSLSSSGDLLVQEVKGEVWAQDQIQNQRERYLNLDGDLLGDGRPHWSISPLTGLPEVVWEERHLGGTRVKIGVWKNGGWAESAVADLWGRDANPVLHHDRFGNRLVAWKNDGKIFLSASGGVKLEFSNPQFVSEYGDAPRIRSTQSKVYVGWQVEEETGSDSECFKVAFFSRSDLLGIIADGGDLPMPTPIPGFCPDARYILPSRSSHISVESPQNTAPPMLCSQLEGSGTIEGDLVMSGASYTLNFRPLSSPYSSSSLDANLKRDLGSKTGSKWDLYTDGEELWLWWTESRAGARHCRMAVLEGGEFREYKPGNHR